MPRRFEDKPAKREQVPVLIGLMGPSGGGKTFSALRLATGIRRVTGGEIYAIDTEARRMKHYADRFEFRHVEFGAPFGSLDYLEAIEHCRRKGARIVIVDSMSHEHEGAGGVLEQHAEETRRLSKAWGVSEDKAKMAAWQKPKAERTRLIRSILQMPINFIFCFRAKQKIKIEAGKDPRPMGWMPIAGEEFLFEMTVNCLLPPASGGMPDWQPEEPGERMMVKLPEQFRDVFLKRLARRPLDEEIGAELAKWAAGDASTLSLFAQLRDAITEAPTLDALEPLRERLAEVPDKKLMPAAEFRELKRIYAERRKALEAPADPHGETVPPEQLEQQEGEPEAEPAT